MKLQALCPRTRFPLQGLLCVLGGFLLCLSFASDFSYSNINTYLISYMRTTGYEEDGQFVAYNPDLTYADFVFVSTTKVLLQGFSMPFLGALASRIGVRISIFLGSMIYSGGFLLTSLAIKSYFPLVVMTLAMHGIGFSLVYATAIGAAQKWFPPTMKGFVGSLVLSGYGFGSLIWIPVQTSFVNYGNLKATLDKNCEHIGTELESKCDKYFTAPEVLEKIPNMFLLLGGIFASLGLVATMLISDPPASRGERLDKVELEMVRKGNEEMAKADEARFSLTPLQVLRTGVFYMAWMGFFNITLTSGILQNYSKTFGLTFINDDHYYAKIGVVSNIFNGLCRIFWGILYDRLGFRGCYLILGSIVTIITGILPFLPYLEADSMEAKVCYGLCMSILYTAFPGIYAIIAPAISDAFGPKHYQANFGLLFTQTMAYSGVIMILTKIPVLYAFLGYPGMFIIAAVMGVLGITTVSFLPKHLDSDSIGEKFR